MLSFVWDDGLVQQLAGGGEVGLLELLYGLGTAPVKGVNGLPVIE